MSLIKIVFSLVTCWLAGYWLGSIPLRNTPAGRWQAWFKGCLGIGLGLGLGSLSYFLWRLVVGPISALFFGLEATTIVVLGVWWAYLRKKGEFPAEPQIKRPGTNGWQIAIGLAFLAASLGTGLAFSLGTVKSPHGAWDAWAIWNREARFIFRESDQWRHAFSPILAHADYPLLLPAAVARSWSYAGGEALIVPAIISAAFAIATCGLLVVSVSYLRGRSLGFIAGLGLLSANAFMVMSADQCADIPLGFYMLATLISFHFYEASGEKNRAWLALAGMTAGLATWTKNEGWLFLLSLLAARALVIAWRERQPGFHAGNTLDKPAGSRTTRLRSSARRVPSWLRKTIVTKDTLYFASGLLPILFCTLAFKIVLAPANDLVAGQGLQTWGRLADASRYMQIGRAFLSQAVNLDPQEATPLVILPIIGLLFGTRPLGRAQTTRLTSILVLGFMLGGYFLVFLATPNDLNWQLNTSLSRLYLQLWPMGVFSLSISLSAPGLVRKPGEI